MHILVAILTALGVAAVWYYRLKAIGGAARDIGKAAEKVANAPRKFAFMRRAGHAGLKSVEDPREAAAILMVLAAGGGGDKPVSGPACAVLTDEAAEQFELDAGEAGALIDHALRMVRDVDVPDGVAARMAQVIISTPGIGSKELVDLDAMLVAATEADGEARAERLKLLQIYRDRAGLRA